MSVQTLNELSETDRRGRMADRCDQLSDAIEENEWSEEVRGRMFETAAMLNCFAHDLRLRATPDAELAAYKQAVAEYQKSNPWSLHTGNPDIPITAEQWIMDRAAAILAANAK